ncbi:MAG: glycosyltransferase family 39 protein [Hyphomicrobiales bacterium]
MNSKTLNYWALILILIAGITLRFYDFFNIPWQHDEYSALFRSYFDSFKDLIYHGVKYSDTHPPGIQVLYYYIIKIFGDAPWMLKLPFLFMGVSSIYLTYRIGKEWFNSTNALFSASLVSVTQLAVMYSQIARMYISGLFFMLCMIIFWHKIVVLRRKKIKLYIGYIVFSVCMIYNHHFTLLLAFIVGVGGLFIIKKKDLLGYVISGACIFLLYIPNLHVFLYQLEQGGLAWLNKPGLFFTYDFGRYLFHYSWIFFGLVVLLVIISFLNRNREKYINKLMRRFCLFWVVSYYLVTFLYSQFVSSILQFSMLLFVLPFFYYLIFSFFKEKAAKFNFIFSVVILLIGSYTLIFEREYYYTFYTSQFEYPTNEVRRLKEKHKDNLDVIFLGDPNIHEYNYQREANNYDFIFVNEGLTNGKIDSLLRNMKSNYLVYSWAKWQRPELDALVKHYYPYVVKKKNYFNGEFYFLSKEPTSNYKSVKRNYCFSKQLNSTSIIYNKDFLVRDWIGEQNLDIDSFNEFPIHVNIKKNEYTRSNDIEVFLKYITRSTDKLPLIVFSSFCEGERVRWHGVPLQNEIMDFDSSYRFYAKYRLVDLDRHKFPDSIRIGVWNNQKINFTLKEFNIDVVQGNPYIYSHLDEILD